MRYNVGDLVFNTSKLSQWNNKYHYKEFTNNMLLTVKFADDKYFSTGCQQLGKCCGMDQWEVNSQTDGRALYGNRRLLHMVEDKEAIEMLLHEQFSAAHAVAAQAQIDEIEKCELEIAKMQEKLQRLKDTERTVEMQFNIDRHNDIVYRIQNALETKSKNATI